MWCRYTLARIGETIPPWGVPVSGCVTFPSVSSTPALSHFRINRSSCWSPILRLNISTSVLIEVVEESLNVRFNHEVVVAELELDRQFVDRVQRTCVRPVPIATTQEILLIDGFQ